jgi:hypothetical protein
MFPIVVSMQSAPQAKICIEIFQENVFRTFSSGGLAGCCCYAGYACVEEI